MKSIRKILTNISDLTLEIATYYPELYMHLDENPLTISYSSNPKIKTTDLEDYFQSLKEVFSKYKKAHK